MCGIVGIITKNPQGFFAQDRDMLKGMLLVNSLRGAHSTGMFGVHRSEHINEHVDIVKAVASPYFLYEWGHTEKFFSHMMQKYHAVIGHGRWATKGSINAINAHPFQEGNITLVHNGGISNDWDLKNYSKHKDIDVDSHLVAKLFSESSADEVLPKLRGAYALVWYDSTDGTIHMARNKERPLFLCMNEKKDSLYFASEFSNLEWVFSRWGEKLNTLAELPPFSHFIFKKGSLEPEIRKYKEAPVRPTSGYFPKETYEEYPLEKPDYSKSGNNRFSAGRGKFTDFDNKILELSSAENGFSIGQTIHFEIDDFNPVSPNSRALLIQGYNQDFPVAEFCCTTTKFSDEDLVKCEGIRGKVDRIVPVSSTITHNRTLFRVFLDDKTSVLLDKLPVKKEGSGWQDANHTYVRVENIDGPLIGMNLTAYTLMCDGGCRWCQKAFTGYERLHPETLGHYQFDDDEGLICSGCMSDYRSNRRN